MVGALDFSMLTCWRVGLTASSACGPEAGGYECSAEARRVRRCVKEAVPRPPMRSGSLSAGFERMKCSSFEWSVGGAEDL